MLGVILLLGFLPGFAWLFFYLTESPRRESRSLIALCFLSGAGFAILALAAQLAFYRLGWAVNPLRSLQVSPFLIWSLVLLSASEEIVKFLAAFFAVRKDPRFQVPLDAMVYMTVAALGFATIENLGSLVGPGGKLLLWDAAAETLILRFVGATLLHALSSSIVGYYWALQIRNFGKKGLLFLGLALAITLHAFFNYLIIVYGNTEKIFLYTLVFLVALALLVLSDFEKLKYKAL